MADEPTTTTVEVTHEIWAALDKRKSRGDSFNDVIKKLINESPAPVGAIEEDPGLETVDITEVEDVPEDEECTHYDIITGETCGDDPTHRQTFRYEDGDPQELYLCEEHAVGE